MKRVHRPTIAALVLLGFASAPLASLAQDVSTGPAGTPTALVQRTAEEVLRVLRDDAASVADRQQRILQIAYENFDFETIPRLVLARHWRRMSATQRGAFVEEFKRNLVTNYGNRIDRYQQEGIEILGERPEARGDVTVRTRVFGGGDDFAVDYRLRQRDERWYVIDVVVEGISVLKSYRSQFQEILNRGGPDLLLKQLREKNDAAEAPTTQATS